MRNQMNSLFTNDRKAWANKGAACHARTPGAHRAHRARAPQKETAPKRRIGGVVDQCQCYSAHPQRDAAPIDDRR
ncbi:hypothetical protein AWB68_07610 [Caballeronia choica]|jgi:hypothetical protein|uniref:Uncharacterized protein n=1 Tax=Caballeronia choica TaxID=326476 RepID=A0A158KWY2_9BURK|nr:hypothetical protein AWB68_07610 [Caballeronia choica]